MPTPTELKVRKRSRRMDIEFDDGSRFSLSFEYLRVHSPSAEVRGHGPGQEVLQINKEQVGVESVEPVGEYAIRIRFDDGHDTGLYSWDYLYELGQHHDAWWQRYLGRLEAAGHTRRG